jgi:predicted Zn-dependent peptidase
MTVQIHKLSNGMRVVTEHMPGLQSASLGVWVNAGGRHERVEQNGIAHFLEHMAFKGTKTRSALQIAEAIEDVGGYINAYTSREVTAYYARVLKDDVLLALDVIGDIIRNPVYDPREMEIERGVILQEIGQSVDTPDDIVFDWLQEAAYPNQAIGRTILGPAERVTSFQQSDLEGFIAEQYGPSQLIVSAAGAVDHDTIVRAVEAQFGDMAASPTTKIEPALYQGGVHQVNKELEQAHFTLALEAPSYLDPAFYISQIYAVAMGGGMSSRLFQEVREKQGLCYSIFASMGAYSDTGMLTIYSGTSADDLQKLSDICIDEMKRAADTFSDAELDRARAQMKAGMLMGLESASSRAERLARVLAIWDRVPPIEEVIGKIDAIDRTSLRDFAAKICTDSTPSLATYGPVGEGLDISQIAGRLAA